MLRTALFTSLSVLGLALAAPALAQDPGAQSWTGPYVGVNVGYGGGQFGYPFSGTSDIGGTNRVSGQVTQSSSGVLGGVQAGYNYQIPSNGFVVGLETDINASDIGAKTNESAINSQASLPSGGLQSRIDYFGTLRGRIGEPVLGGRILPYLTGGFAYGGVKALSGASCAACLSGAGPYGGVSTQTGWTVGGGAEVALTRRLTMKVEYLYVNLGQQAVGTTGRQLNTFSGPVYNSALSENATANLVRVGMNYHF